MNNQHYNQPNYQQNRSPNTSNQQQNRQMSHSRGRGRQQPQNREINQYWENQNRWYNTVPYQRDQRDPYQWDSHQRFPQEQLYVQNNSFGPPAQAGRLNKDPNKFWVFCDSKLLQDATTRARDEIIANAALEKEVLKAKAWAKVREEANVGGDDLKQGLTSLNEKFEKLIEAMTTKKEVMGIKTSLCYKNIPINNKDNILNNINTKLMREPLEQHLVCKNKRENTLLIDFLRKLPKTMHLELFFDSCFGIYFKLLSKITPNSLLYVKPLNLPLCQTLLQKRSSSLLEFQYQSSLLENVSQKTMHLQTFSDSVLGISFKSSQKTNFSSPLFSQQKTSHVEKQKQFLGKIVSLEKSSNILHISVLRNVLRQYKNTKSIFSLSVKHFTQIINSLVVENIVFIVENLKNSFLSEKDLLVVALQKQIPISKNKTPEYDPKFFPSLLSKSSVQTRNEKPNKKREFSSTVSLNPTAHFQNKQMKLFHFPFQNNKKLEVKMSEVLLRETCFKSMFSDVNQSKYISNDYKTMHTQNNTTESDLRKLCFKSLNLNLKQKNSTLKSHNKLNTTYLISQISSKNLSVEISFDFLSIKKIQNYLVIPRKTFKKIPLDKRLITKDGRVKTTFNFSSIQNFNKFSDFQIINKNCYRGKGRCSKEVTEIPVKSMQKEIRKCLYIEKTLVGKTGCSLKMNLFWEKLLCTDLLIQQSKNLHTNSNSIHKQILNLLQIKYIKHEKKYIYQDPTKYKFNLRIITEKLKNTRYNNYNNKLPLIKDLINFYQQITSNILNKRIDWTLFMKYFIPLSYLSFLYIVIQQNKRYIRIKKFLLNFEIDFLKTKGCVYFLYNIFAFAQTYVGHTTVTVLDRFRQHVHNTKNITLYWSNKKSKLHKSAKYKLYKKMANSDVAKWGIFVINNTTFDLRRTEYAYIKLLNPSLNTIGKQIIYNISQRFCLQDRPKNLSLHQKMCEQIELGYLDNLCFQIFEVDGFNFIDLYYLFQQQLFLVPNLITIFEGIFQKTSFTRIKREISIGGYFTHMFPCTSIIDQKKYHKVFFHNTQQFLRILKLKKFRCFKIVVLQKTNTDPLKIIKRLVRSRSNLKFLVNKYSDSEIIGAYKLIRNKQINTRFWECANYRIAYILNKKLGYIPRNRIVIKIPFSYAYNKKIIKNIFLGQISKKQNSLKRYILKVNTRVVFLRRKNIRNLLCNFINFAKLIKVNELVSCSCRSCSNEKISIFGVNKKPLNAKFVPTPDRYRLVYEFKQAIDTALYKNREYNFLKDSLNNVILLALSNYRQTKNTTEVFKQIRRIRSQNKGRVITILDKNAGAIYSFCPKVFTKNIYKMFDYTKPNSNYKLIKKSSDNILKGWFTQYKSININLGNINKKGQIPYAYIIPKFKDLSRYRPIVSYSSHPLVNIFNVVSRGLFFLLEQIAPKSVLFNIMQLATKIKTFSFSKNIYILTFDIKNMFSELPQKEVLKSTIDLIRLASTVTRRKWITIQKRGKKGVRWGKSFDKRNFVQLEFSDLLKFVELDTFNCYFMVGDIILKQITGIPMGSPISPPSAIILCAMAEIIFNKQIKHLHILNNFFFNRYIDDGLVITEDDENGSAKQNAHLFLYYLRIYYPKQLKIIIENEGFKAAFLEMIIKIKNKKIFLKHNNKNYEYIKQNQPQKFMNLINYNSFAPVEQKIGVVIGTMIRVSKLSNNDNQRIKDILKMFWEFISLGYTKNIMVKIFYCLKIRHKQYINIWVKMISIVKRLNI